MDEHRRDQLWNASFETFYDSYYYESIAGSLEDKWQYFDETAKLFVALFASGSAISGWAMWNEPGVYTLWAILAGFAALLAIIHATLGVPRRLEDLGNIRRYFCSLRADLETFRYRMQINPDFPADGFTEEFVGYRERYGEGLQRYKNDILLTKGLRIRTQTNLNNALADSIERE